MKDALEMLEIMGETPDVFIEDAQDAVMFEKIMRLKGETFLYSHEEDMVKEIYQRYFSANI